MGQALSDVELAGASVLAVFRVVSGEMERLAFPRVGRQRFDIAHHFDHCREAARNGTVQRRVQLAGFFDANSQRAHTLRNRGKVGLGETPRLGEWPHL